MSTTDKQEELSPGEVLLLILALVIIFITAGFIQSIEQNLY